MISACHERRLLRVVQGLCHDKGVCIPFKITPLPIQLSIQSGPCRITLHPAICIQVQENHAGYVRFSLSATYLRDGDGGIENLNRDLFRDHRHPPAAQWWRVAPAHATAAAVLIVIGPTRQICRNHSCFAIIILCPLHQFQNLPMSLSVQTCSYDHMISCT